MSFVSCTFVDGVFALKLDFSFMRKKARPSPPKPRSPKPKPAKHLGARPLPPPFPLPPVRRADDLLDAPALAVHPPMPTPSVIVDDAVLSAAPAETLMDDDDPELTRTTSPLEAPKTDLMQQRRDVRKALRNA